MRKFERTDAVAAALGATFIALDREFCERCLLSGCTCTVVALVGWTLSVANIGDSRAVLDTGGREVLPLTYDFRLEDSPSERARIVASGAILRRLALNGSGPCASSDEGVGPMRVWPGGLALSRAIGDADVGKCIVAAPFVKQVRLPQGFGSRIIMASDGVWDAISNGTAAKLVRGVGAVDAASGVVAAALRVRGLRDDTTVVILDITADARPLPEVWIEQTTAAASHRASSQSTTNAVSKLPKQSSSGFLCGLCGGSLGADEYVVSTVEDSSASGSRRMVMGNVEELREVDFQTIMPTPATSGDADSQRDTCFPNAMSFTLPEIMPRISGRLSTSTSAAPDGGAGDTLPAFVDAANTEPPSTPPAQQQAPAGSVGTPVRAPGDATEHAGRAFASGVSASAAMAAGGGPVIRSKYEDRGESVRRGRGFATVLAPVLEQQQRSGGGPAGVVAERQAAAASTEDVSASPPAAVRRMHKVGTHHWGNADEREIEQVMAQAEVTEASGEGGGDAVGRAPQAVTEDVKPKPPADDAQS